MTTTALPPAHRPLMIMAAPNGARLAAADHPRLPLTPDELADCAAELVTTGVSVLHLHVRDTAGRHSLNPAHYRTAIAAIRERVGGQLLLQVTTEAVGRYTPEQQMAAIRDLRPEAVSLALREICPRADAEPAAGRFFRWLRSERIWPQYILYSTDDVRRFQSLRRRGLIAETCPSCLLVVGRYAERLEGRPEELEALLAALQLPEVVWTVCCFGRRENAVARLAVERDGHVRLGFENNRYLCDGTEARDNAALIAQFRHSILDLHRQPATADEIRGLWQTQWS